MWRWEQEWLLGSRKTARSTDSRTAIASLLPVAAVNEKLPLVMLESQNVQLALLFTSIYTSLVLDFVLRQSLGGTYVGHYVMAQLPFPPPSDMPAALRIEIAALASTLQDTDVRLTGADGEEMASWVSADRNHLRARLDARLFHFYGLNREDITKVLDSFEVLERREVAEHGHDRTRVDVLAALDGLEAKPASIDVARS